ncbi:MAG: hypothetical protein P0Y60_00035 [Candidatus Microbacterium colombiense]|nr:MAG: hypothetical protein P0Y60_00035 [Microbacterium sp.]
MIILIALAVLAIWAVVATVVELRRDGYRPTPTDWSRVAEHDLSQRPEATHVYR